MKNIHWSDLRSGLIVFFVALPLCLGIALACGVPPEAGLWAGIVGGTLTTLLSGSRLSVSGPAAGLTSIVLTGMATVQSPEHFYWAVTLSGVFQILLRILNLGRLTAFIPNAVVYGMLSGVGIIIILKQIPHLIGYDPDFEGDVSFFEKFGYNTFTSLIEAFRQLHDGPLIIGLTGILLLVMGENLLEKNITFFRYVPLSLLTVVSGIGMVLFFNAFLPSTFHIYNENRILIPQMIDSLRFMIPDFTKLNYAEFWKLVVTMGVVATLESLLSVEASDKMDPEKRISDKNKELVAQGMGNMICGLIGALPITSVIVRTSANIYSGAKGKLSAFSHALYLLLAILLFADVLSNIPKASLAAILIMVGYKLNKPSLYVKMFKLGLSQFLPFVITMLTMVFTDLLTGVIVGFVISLIFILYRTALSPVQILHKDNDSVEVILPEYVTFFHKQKLEEIYRNLSNVSAQISDDHCRYIDPDCSEIIELLKNKKNER